MKLPLRILLFEDDPDRAGLIELRLKSEGVPCDLVVVDHCAAFTDALNKSRFDLLLTDYSLAKSDGMTALATAKAHRPEVPFVFISSWLRNNVAVELLKGAGNSVPKSELARLAPVIRWAFEQAKIRKQSKLAETKFAAARDVCLGLSSGNELSAVMETLLEKSAAILPEAAAQIMLLDKATDKLAAIVRRNMDLEPGDPDPGMPIERVSLDRKPPHIIRNLEQEEARHLGSEIYVRNGLVSFLGTPFYTQGEPAGVVSVLTREQHDFTDEEIDLVEFLALQAGLAVTHARLNAENIQLSGEVLRKEEEIRKLLSGLMVDRPESPPRAH